MDSQRVYIVRSGSGGVVGGIPIFTNKTSMYDNRRSYNNGYYCPLCPL